MTGAVTVDALLGGRVRVHQPAGGYRAAIDPVLLAACADPPPGGAVVELGCGTGAAMLCLAARRPDLSVTGIEVQPELAALARAGIADAGWGARLAVLDGDAFHDAVPTRADLVMINPPYHDPGREQAPRDPGRARAHLAAATGLDPWIAAARRALKPRGRLVLIHRADRLDAVLAALATGFGSIRILPVWPRQGLPARRVLVSAVAGGRGALSLLPGLVLHRPDSGAYTDAAEAVLRDAAALIA